jgi:hypothetical protein
MGSPQNDTVTLSQTGCQLVTDEYSSRQENRCKSGYELRLHARRKKGRQTCTTTSGNANSGQSEKSQPDIQHRGVAVNNTFKLRKSDESDGKWLLACHRLHAGMYVRVAKPLKVYPSYVRRVAGGKRQSQEIERALVAELRRIHQLMPARD